MVLVVLFGSVFKESFIYLLLILFSHYYKYSFISIFKANLKQIPPIVPPHYFGLISG